MVTRRPVCMVADGRVMDYCNGMEGEREGGRKIEKEEGRKREGGIGRGEDGRKRRKERARERERGRRGGEVERGGGRETDSYIKILEMYECI